MESKSCLPGAKQVKAGADKQASTDRYLGVFEKETEKMLRPSQVDFYAKKAENKNYRFRTWLKMNADPVDLDNQFLRLHEELFSSYDCSGCRNCCKQYVGGIPPEDLEKDAAYLQMSVETFKEMYLEPVADPETGSFVTKHKPCDFLTDQGECKLGDHIPQNCVDFPYTNKPDRMGSLLSFMGAVSVCPVAYEICERLKEHYRFQ